MSTVAEGAGLSGVGARLLAPTQGLAPRAPGFSHWGLGRPRRACSSCIMPGCMRSNPCPRGLLLAGTGVPSCLRGLGSGGSSGWRGLCSGADSSSSGGLGAGGSSCCSRAGVRRKEGRERRCEELLERCTRLLGTETSRRDPGSGASLQLLAAPPLALPVASAVSASPTDPGAASAGAWCVGHSSWPLTSSRLSGSVSLASALQPPVTMRPSASRSLGASPSGWWSPRRPSLSSLCSLSCHPTAFSSNSASTMAPIPSALDVWEPT